MLILMNLRRIPAFRVKKDNKETPLMRQYYAIKAKHPGALLLFRVCDFYETFGKDAIKTANILGIVLTSRNNGNSKIELVFSSKLIKKLFLPNY